jgi:hypothetical protein
MIDKEVRDEKAVKLAIGRIYKGEYTVVHKDPALQEQEEQAILAGIGRAYEDLRPDDDEDIEVEIEIDEEPVVEVPVVEEPEIEELVEEVAAEEVAEAVDAVVADDADFEA